MFKSMCRQKQRQYKDTIYASIRDNRHCNTDLWKIIKQCQGKSGVSSNITGDTWFTYFNNLLNSEPNVDNAFKQHICEVIRDHDGLCDSCDEDNPTELNDAIIVAEVEDVLKTLDDNKSPGIDGLPHEVLKHIYHIQTFM